MDEEMRATAQRVALLAQADQQAAEFAEFLTRAVDAVRADLVAGHEPLLILQESRLAAAGNGVEYCSIMLGLALLRLARQDPTP